MKILVGISTYSANLQEPSGGSERQALGNAHALADRGHDVNYRNLLWKAPDWGRDYDIIHLFNANGPNGPYQSTIIEAHDRDVPVVLSPVFWPVEEMKDEMMTGIDNEAVIKLYFESYFPVVRNSDFLLPNAEDEMRKVEDFADVGKGDLPYQVVPNAINLNEIERAEPQSLDDWGDYILCVGRVEPRKNQHRLIQAMEMLWMQGYDLNLVLIGNPNWGYLERYSDIFEGHEDRLIMTKEAMPPNVVLSAMGDAEALVMPSWLETPGLVALEGAAMGADVVATNRGTAPEYFGDLIHYCEPDRPYSIAEAIEKTINRETPSKLQEIVLDRYNYEVVGKLNERMYEEVLNG